MTTPDPNVRQVTSFTDPSKTYTLVATEYGMTCTCKAYEFSPARDCKHIRAALAQGWHYTPPTHCHHPHKKSRYDDEIEAFRADHWKRNEHLANIFKRFEHDKFVIDNAAEHRGT